MALTQPIKISDQARIIEAVLSNWAQPRGGDAVIASNLYDMWAQAIQSSKKPRILICYNGEQSRGSADHANAWHRVDRQWVVAVTRGRGWAANRGDSLSQTVVNAEPFYDTVETVRDLIRSIWNISEELPSIDFNGIKPMQMGSQVIDGYQISFSTANDIPMILTSPDNSQN